MIDFGNDMALTQKMLGALEARVHAAFQNIANQNTPGYKRRIVHFEDLLREKLERGASVDDVTWQETRDTSGPPEQNTVSLVDEMALLDKTKLLHELVTRRAGGYFRQLNSAIYGR